MNNSLSLDNLHLAVFSQPLNQILVEELAQGNKITETSKGWPTEQAIIVFLEKPFYKQYENAEVIYNELNDRHYWKAEYVDRSANHTLACGF